MSTEKRIEKNIIEHLKERMSEVEDLKTRHNLSTTNFENVELNDDELNAVDRANSTIQLALDVYKIIPKELGLDSLKYYKTNFKPSLT